MGAARAELVAELEPLVGKAYADIAGEPTEVRLHYEPAWRRTGLAAALAASRDRGPAPPADARGARIATTSTWSSPACRRVPHASQGEQRCVAFALRLAAHVAVTERLGSPPLLLLDDVFSELDPDRAHALVAHLPAGAGGGHHGRATAARHGAGRARCRPRRADRRWLTTSCTP